MVNIEHGLTNRDYVCVSYDSCKKKKRNTGSEIFQMEAYLVPPL